ncbi:MAG: UbiD family decarboxylase [Trichlorobacter sp.]|uniref:UbiD family decarboxylase n=1 Tax=Trichlorobacter sp. TaxID=2911007 RepID=UPI00256E8F65|nr:UbiD family decarboxylase [Trichlorobacter sp.]MDK9716550.1 UbiD family decarboxylase [Trichlorobacter sp.]
MLSSLHDFIEHLEHLHDLQKVSAPVATRLEIAAITRRISSYPKGGPALLFQQPDQYPFPVATNLFGSLRRMRLALGLDSLEDLTTTFGAILQTLPLQGLSGLGELLASHPDLACCRPVAVADGPCREELVPGADLQQLPFLQNWPDDGSAAGSGRYITLGQVMTVAPDGSDPNCGIYRCQIHDAHSLAIRWRPGSGAAQHHQLYLRQGRRMPLAIVLGGPPALTLAAAWPLPDGLDELGFAGWLRGASIPTVGCPHGPLQVPAEAELVIEGFAEPGQTLLEGPFGNHTGQYDPAGPAVRVTVERITHRRRAIIPATVVGPPPQEDCWMMLGWERLLAALLPRLVPGVRDIRMPLPWVFRSSAVISLENPSPHMVRKTVQALWQLPWFRKAHLLIMVDAGIAAHDLQQVAWRTVNETGWLDDLIRDEAGGRLAVDATRRSVEALLPDPGTDGLLTQRWKEYGLP